MRKKYQHNKIPINMDSENQELVDKKVKNYVEKNLDKLYKISKKPS